MNKAQKIVTGFFAIALMAIAVLTVFYIRADPTGGVIIDLEANSSIFYYGETCPHCLIVEEFMENNSIETQMKIIKKESFANKTNGQELIKVGEFCKIEKQYIGAVPLLFDSSEGKCYIGDKDIISYFKIKLNLA